MGDKHLKNRETNQRDGIRLHSTTTVSYQTFKPLFDIRCDDNNHCLERCDGQVKKEFANTVHKLGQMTWQQIETSARTGLGYEKIPFEQIKANSNHYPISKDEKIKVFRLTDAHRLAGIRKDRTFVILWVTQVHDLY
ncbi:MAG: hypothetical protein ABSF37_00650 [Sedimentisphaerales bacterium]|jgi:hypothetical protein